MPAEFWPDVARMALCGLLVAAAAVPVGFAAWLISKRNHQPIFLPIRRWSAPWSGYEVLILFITATAAPTSLISPILSASGFYPAVYGPEAAQETWEPMQSLWSSVFFTPMFVGVVWCVLRLAYPNWRSGGFAPAPRVAGGIATWLILHPIVVAVHFAVLAVFLLQEWRPDSHPLETKFREGRPVVDDILFAIQAALAAPLLEEVLFRGALVPWLLGKRNRPAILMGLAIVLAVVFSIRQSDDGQTEMRAGSVIFAALLLALGAVLHVRVKRHRRTMGAIYSSAALFALVHSTVWPSPIPLFVLGLGLGWLTIRTRGILAPVIVHGLFNAVSVLFVLRG